MKKLEYVNIPKNTVLKRYALSVVFSLFSICLFSQNNPQQTSVSVEKSVFGIQTGYLGVWVHHESKLSNQIALRSEAGFDSGFWSGDFYEKTGFILTPVLTLESRWYYNLNKRASKSKRIEGNSGNFISVKTSYHPDWFVISNYDNLRIISDISIIPTWGIRRNIGNNFNYETGIGLGYRYIFAKQAGYREDKSVIATNFLLRIGYRF